MQSSLLTRFFKSFLKKKQHCIAPRALLLHTLLTAVDRGQAQLCATVTHFIFFWKYCESADIITEQPSLKVINLSYSKAEACNP